MGQALSAAKKSFIKTLVQKASGVLMESDEDAIQYCIDFCSGEAMLNDHDERCENLPEESVLAPSSDLKLKLFGWPDEPLTPKNSVVGQFGKEPYRQKRAGDVAVDFSLETPFGSTVQLAKLLGTKPVLMVPGMTTCPHFQTFVDEMESLANEKGEQVHFLCVNSMQPHPKGDASFETGKNWEFPFSDIRQPIAAEDRRQDAEKVANMLPSWTVVIDSMLPDFMNPIFSTYGPAPRSVWLIDTCGLIVASQLWYNTERSKSAIENLLAQRHVGKKRKKPAS